MNQFIKNRKELEQKLQMLQELNKSLDIHKEYEKLKDTFIHLFSYEARAKLNTINGFAELLNSKDLDDSLRKEYLKNINQSGNELLNILDENLIVAQLEIGELEIDYKKINLVEFFKDLKREFEFLKHQFRKHNVELKIITGNSNADFINTDPNRFKQIFQKLFNSSVQYIYGGYIELGYIRTGENSFQFFLKDTGVGIQEKIIKNIRKGNVLINSEQKTKSDEITFNLYIAKKLIRHLGGDLCIRSEIGKGAEFTFTINTEG